MTSKCYAWMVGETPCAGTLHDFAAAKEFEARRPELPEAVVGRLWRIDPWLGYEVVLHVPNIGTMTDENLDPYSPRVTYWLHDRDTGERASYSAPRRSQTAGRS